LKDLRGLSLRGLAQGKAVEFRREFAIIENGFGQGRLRFAA